VAIWSFGAWFRVLGRQVFTLPWEHVGYRPLLDNIYPGRLAMYVSLGVAVATASWASWRDLSRRLRIGLTVVALLVLVPNLAANAWRTTPDVPPFITQDLYRNCLSLNDKVLMFPFGPRGDSILWQADTDFRFRMAGGYLTPSPPPSFQKPAGVADIAIYGEVPDHQLEPVRQYVRLKHVTVILVDPAVKDFVDWPTLLRPLAKPVDVGGVLVYRLSGTPPGPCTA